MRTGPPSPRPAPDPRPGLERALQLLRDEARSFPGAEGSAAVFAISRTIEREIAAYRPGRDQEGAG